MDMTSLLTITVRVTTLSLSFVTSNPFSLCIPIFPVLESMLNISFLFPEIIEYVIDEDTSASFATTANSGTNIVSPSFTNT